MNTDRMRGDPARDDLLILTDALDRPAGTATKERVHREGLLHRAFSVLLYREGGGGREYLLARRAAGKYHSAGLWANSCCSHPRAGEALVPAALRRVREELGCGAGGLAEAGCFVYRAVFPDGLCEYECDHVLVGACEGEPSPDPAEIMQTRWLPAEEIAAWLTARPEDFAPWASTALTMAIRREE